VVSAFYVDKVLNLSDSIRLGAMALVIIGVGLIAIFYGRQLKKRID